MKMKTKLIVILAIMMFQSCKIQKSQTKNSLPQIENQVDGELDYTNGGFELIQWKKNGDEITLGRIDKTGEIHFSPPEYDIKALGRNHSNHHFESQFDMHRCKGKGDFDMVGTPLFKTPYDDIYSNLYPPLYVKKYGVYIAVLSPVSNEEMLNNNFLKVVGNKYYWMYMDRDLHYQDVCIQESLQGAGLEIERSADVQLKKGWNFIKANLVEVQSYGENNEHIIPKKMLFTLSSPKSSNVKYYLERKMDDEEIQVAKKEYEMQGQ